MKRPTKALFLREKLNSVDDQSRIDSLEKRVSVLETNLHVITAERDKALEQVSDHKRARTTFVRQWESERTAIRLELEILRANHV